MSLAEMPEPDRAMGERLHAIIKASAPSPLAETLARDARVCQGRQGRRYLSHSSHVRRTPRIGREAVPASMPLAGAGMRWHVHSGSHAAESFVSGLRVRQPRLRLPDVVVSEQ